VADAPARRLGQARRMRRGLYTLTSKPWLLCSRVCGHHSKPCLRPASTSGSHTPWPRRLGVLAASLLRRADTHVTGARLSSSTHVVALFAWRPRGARQPRSARPRRRERGVRCSSATPRRAIHARLPLGPCCPTSPRLCPHHRCVSRPAAWRGCAAASGPRRRQPLPLHAHAVICARITPPPLAAAPHEALPRLSTRSPRSPRSPCSQARLLAYAAPSPSRSGLVPRGRMPECPECLSDLE
jgi:hypothetical protein